MATANPLPELEHALHKLVQLEPLTPDERALVQRRLDEAPIDDVDHSLTPEDIDELAQGMAEAEEEGRAGTLRPVGELLARLRQIEAS